MSKPLENKSRASGEEIDIDYQSKSLHAELNTIIREMVTEATSHLEAPQPVQLRLEDLVRDVPPQMQMKENTSNEQALAALPISFSRPEDLVKEALADVDVEVDDKDTPDTAAEKKAQKGHPVVGQLSNITFELPENCIARRIDMDKIADINPMIKCSFAERLKGWSVMRKQRPTEDEDLQRYDTYFRHPGSRRMFRSVVEVVDFILYETKPGNRSKESSGILDHNLDGNLTDESSTVNRKRESTSIDDGKENAKREKEMVENFLKDSWLNLMNSDKSEGDKLQEKYEEISYEEDGNEEVAEARAKPKDV